MTEIHLCERQSLCVDCDNIRCTHQGKIGADCPKYHCDRPEDFRLQCETCGFIKKYVKEMRAEYEKVHL